MSGITLSCAFATSLDTPEHIRIAEQSGYARAWAYDSPALYPDVWGILYLAAERSETIGLGPAVLNSLAGPRLLMESGERSSKADTLGALRAAVG